MTINLLFIVNFCQVIKIFTFSLFSSAYKAKREHKQTNKQTQGKRKRKAKTQGASAKGL